MTIIWFLLSYSRNLSFSNTLKNSYNPIAYTVYCVRIYHKNFEIIPTIPLEWQSFNYL